MPSGLKVSRGTVFWREPPAGSRKGAKPHHWVVITNPRCVNGSLRVIWVSLSSVKTWMRYPPEAYQFNVGKSNKYLDARNDSTPDVRYAEVVTLEEIEEEGPKRHGVVRVQHVDGICRQLESSKAVAEGVREFYAQYGKQRDR